MKRLFAFAKIFLLLNAIVSAETISLEDARTLALANSHSLAKYNLTIKSGILDEKSHVYSNLPSLSLGLGASMNLWNPVSSTPLENPLDSFGASANFSVSQKLFEGGKSGIQKAIYEIASESARKDAMAEYFNVLDSADSAYYAVLEAAASLEVEESSLQTAVLSLSIAEIRHESGILNQGDYLKVLAEKETRENARNRARRNLSLSTAKLTTLAGLDETRDPEQIDFSGYEDVIVSLGNISDEKAASVYAELWKLLAAANPSLAKAELSSLRAGKNLSLARRGYFPALGASFSTGLNFTPNDGMEMSSGRISLSANIPLDYWVISNNVEKSRIDLDQAALDYAAREISLDTELQEALLNACSDAGSVVSSRRSLEYADKHFEFVLERYRLSQSSVTELMDATSLLMTTRDNLIKAQYGFLRSLSKLRSLGALDDEEKLLKILAGNR